MDPKTKELIVLIMSWVTGIGITVAGIFIIEMRTYLLPIGITIMLTALGLDIGFNFIPHAKADIKERQLAQAKSKTAIEMQKLGFEELPINTTESVNTIEGFFQKIVEPVEPPPKDTKKEKEEIPFLSE